MQPEWVEQRNAGIGISRRGSDQRQRHGQTKYEAVNRALVRAVRRRWRTVGHDDKNNTDNRGKLRYSMLAGLNFCASWSVLPGVEAAYPVDRASRLANMRSMNPRFHYALALMVAFASTARAQIDRITGRPFATRSEVLAQHGMVCTSHPLATQIGIDVLKAGGSAVDAAIAANAALGLMEPIS